jgi:cellobiose phosphorylase
VDGLRIDPCIPSSWPGFKATRQFRGAVVEIDVRNPDGVCRGVRSIALNGEPLPDNLLPAGRLAAHNRVEVVLG